MIDSFFWAGHPDNPAQKKVTKVKRKDIFRPAPKKIEKRESTTALYRAQTQVPQRYTEPPQVLQSIIEYYRVLQNTKYYRVLQGTTTYYRVLQSTTKYYEVL